MCDGPRCGRPALSTFIPTSIRFDPPDEPDYLAGAVLHSLTSPMPACAIWGPVRTLLLGAISFGLLPLLLLSSRLQPFVQGQSIVFTYAQQWIGKRLRSDEGAGEVGRQMFPLIKLAKWLGVLLIILELISRFRHGTIVHYDVWSVTYGFRWLNHATFSQPDLVRAHKLWLGLLTFAYFIHYVAVKSAAARL